MESDGPRALRYGVALAFVAALSLWMAFAFHGRLPWP